MIQEDTPAHTNLKKTTFYLNCCCGIQATSKSVSCQSIYQCFQLKIKTKDYTFLDEFINDICSLLKEVSSNMNPVGIYMLKLNNKNTRTRCEICSKLTIKIPERRHWRRSGVFIVNFGHISHLVLVFLLLTLNM